MSWWDDQVSAVKDAATGIGVKDIMSAYTDRERSKRGSWQASAAQQASARQTPEVESQNFGDPQSIKPTVPQKNLVGDMPKDAAVVDKKMIYIGGGLVAVVVVVGLIAALK